MYISFSHNESENAYICGQSTLPSSEAVILENHVTMK